MLHKGYRHLLLSNGVPGLIACQQHRCGRRQLEQFCDCLQEPSMGLSAM